MSPRHYTCHGRYAIVTLLINMHIRVYTIDRMLFAILALVLWRLSLVVSGMLIVFTGWELITLCTSKSFISAVAAISGKRRTTRRESLCAGNSESKSEARGRRRSGKGFCVWVIRWLIGLISTVYYQTGTGQCGVLIKTRVCLLEDPPDFFSIRVISNIYTAH